MTDDTTSASAQAEREQFNAWYNPYEFRKEYDKYGPTEAAWSVWQARAAIAASAPTGQGAGLTDEQIINLWEDYGLPPCNTYGQVAFARAVLATRSAGDGQAVACRYRSKHDRRFWAYSTEPLVDVHGGYEIEPLYLAPPPAASVRDAQDAQDAARYRKIKADNNACRDLTFCLFFDVDGGLNPVDSKDMDAAIDAERKRGKANG